MNPINVKNSQDKGRQRGRSNRRNGAKHHGGRRYEDDPDFVYKGKKTRRPIPEEFVRQIGKSSYGSRLIYFDVTIDFDIIT